LKLIYENARWLDSVVSYGAIETIQTLETADDSSGPRTDILPRHIHGTYKRIKKFISGNDLKKFIRGFDNIIRVGSHGVNQ
jgi:hypothetical protein